MKKLIFLLLTVLIVYAIYYDITVGTLQEVSTQPAVTENAAKPAETSIPYFEANVKPGDTLITIVEHKIKKPLPVPINDLIHDFQSLNPGQTAENIQLGKTYRFPNYKK